MYLAFGLDNGLGVGIVENGEIIATVGSGHTIDEVVNAEAWATNSDRIGTRVKSSELVHVVNRADEYKVSFVTSERTKRVSGDTPVKSLFRER